MTMRPDSFPGFFPEAGTVRLDRFGMEWFLYAIHDSTDMVFLQFVLYV